MPAWVLDFGFVGVSDAAWFMTVRAGIAVAVERSSLDCVRRSRRLEHSLGTRAAVRLAQRIRTRHSQTAAMHISGCRLTVDEAFVARGPYRVVEVSDLRGFWSASATVRIARMYFSLSNTRPRAPVGDHEPAPLEASVEQNSCRSPKLSIVQLMSAGLPPLNLSKLAGRSGRGSVRELCSREAAPPIYLPLERERLIRQLGVDLSRSVRLRFDGHREAISHQRRLQTENVGLRPMKFLNPRGQKNGQNGLDLSIDLQSLMDR